MDSDQAIQLQWIARQLREHHGKSKFLSAPFVPQEFTFPFRASRWPEYEAGAHPAFKDSILGNVAMDWQSADVRLE